MGPLAAFLLFPSLVIAADFNAEVGSRRGAYLVLLPGFSAIDFCSSDPCYQANEERPLKRTGQIIDLAARLGGRGGSGVGPFLEGRFGALVGTPQGASLTFAALAGLQLTLTDSPALFLNVRVGDRFARDATGALQPEIVLGGGLGMEFQVLGRWCVAELGFEPFRSLQLGLRVGLLFQ